MRINDERASEIRSERSGKVCHKPGDEVNLLLAARPMINLSFEEFPLLAPLAADFLVCFISRCCSDDTLHGKRSPGFINILLWPAPATGNFSLGWLGY
jgi:hypothetical protein